MSNQSVLDEPYELVLSCLKISQPIGDFFIASIGAKDLCQITFYDVRRMERERDIETYLGIQRPLNQARVKEISSYVNTVDACFPTAVILAVSGKCAEYDPENKVLILKSNLEAENEEDRITSVKIARVLDGQHRIDGLRNFGGDVFDVNVSIFIDMDIASQAYLFSTVNLAQTKVNKSLVYDLYEYAKARSPQKACHNIAVALDKLESSPFYQRIKRLGVSTRGKLASESLTQATFVEALLPYISENKNHDRDLFLRGKKPSKVSAEDSKKLIFRNMFLEEKDVEIADLLLNYFGAVRKRWPMAWSSIEQGSILGKTNGFRAFMRLLRPIYLSISEVGKIPTEGAFLRVLEQSELRDEQFTIDTFKPGTSGESALFNWISSELKLNK